MQIMIFHYAGFLAQPLHILVIPRQGNVRFFLKNKTRFSLEKSLNLGGKAFNFFSVTSFLNDINVFLYNYYLLFFNSRSAYVIFNVHIYGFHYNAYQVCT